MRCRVRGGYPPDWPNLARRLKQEAGWRCERCGHPDDPALRRATGAPAGRVPCDACCTHPQDGKQRILTVHHLDGDKGNCEPWNCATLCQVCHLSVQGRVDFYRPYLMPHTPWMERHVAAFNVWAQEHGRTLLPNALEDGEPHEGVES